MLQPPFQQRHKRQYPQAAPVIQQGIANRDPATTQPAKVFLFYFLVLADFGGASVSLIYLLVSVARNFEDARARGMKGTGDTLSRVPLARASSKLRPIYNIQIIALLGRYRT